MNAQESFFAVIGESDQSLVEIATQIKTTELYLMEVIAGTRRCSPVFAEQLAKALGMPNDALREFSITEKPREKHRMKEVLLTVINKSILPIVLGVVVFIVQTRYSNSLDQIEKRAQVASSVSTLLNKYSERFSRATNKQLELFDQFEVIDKLEEKKRYEFKRSALKNNREISTLLQIMKRFGLANYCPKEKRCPADNMTCGEDGKDCPWEEIETVLLFDMKALDGLLIGAVEKESKSDGGFKDAVKNLQKARDSFIALLPNVLFGIQRVISDAVGQEYENARE